MDEWLGQVIQAWTMKRKDGDASWILELKIRTEAIELCFSLVLITNCITSSIPMHWFWPSFHQFPFSTLIHICNHAITSSSQPSFQLLFPSPTLFVSPSSLASSIFLYSSQSSSLFPSLHCLRQHPLRICLSWHIWSVFEFSFLFSPIIDLISVI